MNVGFWSTKSSEHFSFFEWFRLRTNFYNEIVNFKCEIKFSKKYSLIATFDPQTKFKSFPEIWHLVMVKLCSNILSRKKTCYKSCSRPNWPDKWVCEAEDHLHSCWPAKRPLSSVLRCVGAGGGGGGVSWRLCVGTALLSGGWLWSIPLGKCRLFSWFRFSPRVPVCSSVLYLKSSRLPMGQIVPWLPSQSEHLPFIPLSSLLSPCRPSECWMFRLEGSFQPSCFELTLRARGLSVSVCLWIEIW